MTEGDRILMGQALEFVQQSLQRQIEGLVVRIRDLETKVSRHEQEQAATQARLTAAIQDAQSMAGDASWSSWK